MIEAGSLFGCFGNFFSYFGGVICWALLAASCEECGSEKKADKSEFCNFHDDCFIICV